MRVKTILRRMNRGLILGLVLLIGLVGFIVVEERNFQKQQPQIQETLEQYLQDVSELSILPAEYQRIDVKVPADVVDDKKAEMKEVLDRYWASMGTPSDAYMNTKENVVIEWNNMLETNAQGNGYVKKWTGIAKGNANITKTGPGRALVAFPYSVALEVCGVANSNHLSGTIYTDQQYKYGGDKFTEEIKQEESKYSIEGDLQVEMIHADGEWKILAAVYGYQMSSAVTAE